MPFLKRIGFRLSSSYEQFETFAGLIAKAPWNGGAPFIFFKPRSDEDARHFVQQWKAIGGQHVHS